MLKAFGEHVFRGSAPFLLLFIISLASYGQSPKETLDFAEEQAEIGVHRNAIKAYKRVLFFQKERFALTCLRRMARSYHELGEFPKAIRYFEKAAEKASDDSLKRALTLKKVQNQLQQRSFQKAYITLQEMSGKAPEPLKEREHFYRALTYFGQKRYEAAKPEFRNLLPDTAQRAKEMVDSLLTKVQKKAKNPKTAKVLSYVLPGAGQLYVGNIKEAVNSFLLTSSLVALGVVTSYQMTVLDAVLGVGNYWFRYYQGGASNAEDLAKQKNQQKRGRIYQKLLRILQKK
ncbi:MAG: tetratricopeptide repeat protein [Flavobacteriales bacterium]